jgi:hypothetical protein
VIAWRDVDVPYGSYVLVDRDLRLETSEFKDLVQKKLDENLTSLSPHARGTPDAR